MRGRNIVRTLTASLLLACTFPALAAAEVRLGGTVDHLVLTAKDATMAEIVSAMQSDLDCKIALRGSTDRRFTGTYSGSLRQVLTRLLGGADYVMSSDRNQIRIGLLGGDGRADARSASASNVQGWTGQPSELPARAPSAAGASVAAAVDPEPANGSDVQGWTGQPSELPARAPSAAGTSVAAAVDPEPANGSDVQGWTGQPSELPVAARTPVGLNVAAATNPELATNSDVQGWTGLPSELPARPNPR